MDAWCGVVCEVTRTDVRLGEAEILTTVATWIASLLTASTGIGILWCFFAPSGMEQWGQLGLMLMHAMLADQHGPLRHLLLVFHTCPCALVACTGSCTQRN